MECYNCGKRGHMSIGSARRTRCVVREENGEMALSDPRRGTVNGQEVRDIVLDTGCSQTMVHSGLVPPEKLLDEESVVVRCVHGDSVLYPLASASPFHRKDTSSRQWPPCRTLYPPLYCWEQTSRSSGSFLEPEV